MAGFTPDSIQRVRDALDIESVVESYLPLKRTGSSLKALCPFHNEKTPSFNVNPSLQIFKCFGCGEGGDIFRFVMKMDGVGFAEAVQLMADRAGITLERTGNYNPESARENADEKTSLFWVTSKAMAYFEGCLADKNQGKDAREYLLSRGFTMEVIKAWRLGWAPEGFGGLYEHLVQESGGKREKTLEYAIKAGLMRRGENGDPYVFFRGRVMFPILDTQRRAIGFGGRLLKEDPRKRVGKYINSPETILFSKGRTLFGLDAASRDIRLSGTAIIVEGYTDVIMCHQHGVRNVVGTLGTALTRDHIRLLRRYSDTVVARFDADEAGAAATDKALRLFVEEDMPLKIIRSEEFKDSCEYLPRHGAEGFAKELEAAEDAFSYHLRNCFTANKLRSVDEKAAAVRKAMEVVNLTPDPMKLEMLKKQVANTAGVPIASLPQPDRRRQSRTSATSTTPATGIAPSKPVSGKNDNIIERKLIECMLQSREWCDQSCAILPPEEYSTEWLRDLASELHDEWGAADQIDATKVFGRVQHPEASKFLSDILMGERPELKEEEFEETLTRAQILQLQEEFERQQQQIHLSQAEGNSKKTTELVAKHWETRRKIDKLLQCFRYDFA